jgi:hypothetical protein|tara:strand:- start:28 stop:612 length:585 start_codon:yes stop_codon:yes gene_type:complete
VSPRTDYVLDNQSGQNFRTELNQVLQSILTLNEGSGTPSTTAKFMLFVDTSDGNLKARNASNDGNVTIGPIGTTNLGLATLASPTFTGDVVINSTSALQLPSGTTAQRPGSPTAGDLRFNSDNNAAEIYDGSSFVAVGGGASGSGGDQIFYENELTVTTDHTITAARGAHCVGPLVINAGRTLTVPSNSHLVIS